ncbi:hypothetical protein [Planomonospora algeriensis]
MKRLKAVATTLISSAALLAGSVTTASPANAEVWSCQTSKSPNVARTQCFAGWGAYRVSATCVTSKYPYRITIYGNTVTRERGTLKAPTSTVRAAGYNCSITDAGVDVH